MFRIRIPIGLLLLSIVAGICYLEYSQNISYVSQIIISILLIWGLWEFYRLYEHRGVRPYVWYGIFSGSVGLAIICICLTIRYPHIHEIYISYGTAIVAVIFLRSLLDAQEEKVLEKIFSSLAGLFYVCFLLSYLLMIRALGNTQEGIFYLLFVILVAKGTDIGGYIAGKLWGKHKLYPAISPKKSWEGWIGGLIVSLAFALGLRYGLPVYQKYLTVLYTIVFALAMSLFSLLGDFSESLLKRRCQVKDSNNLIPEFGGILDLIDSLIFTAPVGYYLLLYAGVPRIPA